MTTISRRSVTGLLALGALTTTRAFAADPIRIGIALSQTGNLADSAEHYRKGVELWRDQLNARGGLLGRQVEIVLYDDRSDPATAARLYERLITSDNVDLLISPWGSASTATASAVAEKHKRVFINAGGASEAIHGRGFKHIFQSAAAISAYVQGIGPLAEKNGLKTMAFIARDYGAARDMRKSLDKLAGKHKFEIVTDRVLSSRHLRLLVEHRPGASGQSRHVGFGRLPERGDRDGTPVPVGQLHAEILHP